MGAVRLGDHADLSGPFACPVAIPLAPWHLPPRPREARRLWNQVFDAPL